LQGSTFTSRYVDGQEDYYYYTLLRELATVLDRTYKDVVAMKRLS
jgi:hypothetical protein